MRNKTIVLILCAFLFLSATACTRRDAPGSSGSSAGSGSSEDSSQEDLSPSERSMANFVKKLKAGNYVIEIPDRLKTTACSPEQVSILYNNATGGYGFAFMTLNDETFLGYIDEGEIYDVDFYYPGKAIDAMAENLPNHWIRLSGGNMFELFYGSDQTPLEFTSNDENVKQTLLAMGAYNQTVLQYMQEVHIILDAEDPTRARFTCEVDTGGSMIRFDDIDITLTFGNAQSNELVEAWLKDPVYPETRKGWNEQDIAMLDNVLYRDYGNENVPFPDFASYAMIFDKNAYSQFTGFAISDAHATKQNVEDYKSTLISNGYNEAQGTLPDGSSATVYRKLLREDYRAYAQLYLEYDNGFRMIGTLYHDNPSYEGLAAISEVLEKYGFAALDETDVFDGWNAVERSASQTEGWSHFFDYDLYMPFILTYEDEEAARAYLEAYGKKLEAAGLKQIYSPGEYSTGYESADTFTSFRYTFSEEDNTVMIETKKEKNLTPDEIKSLLEQFNLPQTDIHGDYAARNLTPYYYEVSGFDGLRLSIYQPYDTAEEAENYLDQYVASIMEQGYEQVDPKSVGSYRSYAFLNQDLGKYVAFDINYGQTVTRINFEIVSLAEMNNTIVNIIRH